MIYEYQEYGNELTSVECESPEFYLVVGKPMYTGDKRGAIKSMTIVDEPYRPLHVKIRLESGDIIRLFKFDRTTERSSANDK